MYYKGRDLVNGIYVSRYNIMFQWNDFENQTYFKGWKKKVLKRFFTEREAFKFEVSSLSNIKENYKRDTEKRVIEHNYSDTVVVKIDTFEFSYDIYATIRNFLVEHEGYVAEQEYMPTRHAIFKKPGKEEYHGRLGEISPFV